MTTQLSLADQLREVMEWLELMRIPEPKKQNGQDSFTPCLRTLPDCMMPDGAEPCLAFRELEAENAKLRAALKAWRGYDDEWYAGPEHPRLVEARRLTEDALK